MILLAADGVPDAKIAWVADITRPTVIAWRERYESGGIPALGISFATVAQASTSPSGRSTARPSKN